MRNKIVGRPIELTKNKKRHGVQRLLAEADDVDRKSHVDYALLCQRHHLAIHIENAAARRHDDYLLSSRLEAAIAMIDGKAVDGDVENFEKISILCGRKLAKVFIAERLQAFAKLIWFNIENACNL